MIDASTPNTRAAIHRVFDQVSADSMTALAVREGNPVCDAFGVSLPKQSLVQSAADVAEIATDMATDMGVPVGIKIVSPGILQETPSRWRSYEILLRNAKSPR